MLSYVLWNLYDREKRFPTEKRTVSFFASKCLICDFSQFLFYFTIMSESESVSESELFFGFGSSQNIRIISDSDPQHCF
jgi:hypothetical protein